MMDLFECVAICCWVAAVAAAISNDATSSYYRQEAIKHGAAYYDPQTAKFTWKGCGEPSTQKQS